MWKLEIMFSHDRRLINVFASFFIIGKIIQIAQLMRGGGDCMTWMTLKKRGERYGQRLQY